MRILLVEDDKTVASSLELMLKAEGVNLTVAYDGEEGQDLARHYDFDLIMLDLNLPDMNGLSLLKSVRAKKSTPVIIVSGEADIETKVSALKAGADDYVTKPFHRDELIARMYSIVRRSAGHSQSTIGVDDLTLDLENKTVEIAGEKVLLTRKEYAILELLVRKKGTTITKEMFLSDVYGGMDEPEPKVIDVFVCKLRKKLSGRTGRNYIQTVWGRGYAVGTDDMEQSMEMDMQAA